MAVIEVTKLYKILLSQNVYKLWILIDMYSVVFQVFSILFKCKHNVKVIIIAYIVICFTLLEMSDIDIMHSHKDEWRKKNE